MSPALVVTLIAAVLGPLLSYLAAARKLSGRIKDTEATELWAESRSIREWSTARVKELQDHIEDLEKRMLDLERTNIELVEANRIANKEVARLQKILEYIEEEKVTLQRLLARLQEERPKQEEG